MRCHTTLDHTKHPINHFKTELTTLCFDYKHSHSFIKWGAKSKTIWFKKYKEINQKWNLQS